MPTSPYVPCDPVDFPDALALFAGNSDFHSLFFSNQADPLGRLGYWKVGQFSVSKVGHFTFPLTSIILRNNYPRFSSSQVKKKSEKCHILSAISMFRKVWVDGQLR